MPFKVYGEQRKIQPKIDQQYLEDSEMIFALLIQHHKNETYFHKCK